VLPKEVRARVAIEAGATLGWERYVGVDGIVIGVDHYGASAPADVLYREFGLTADNVVASVLSLVGQ
jgi:transketolase